MLLQFAIREAEKAGVNFVSIKPVIRNTEAIRLFQKVGFECVGRIELFMDLRKEERGEWKSDLNLLGLRFYY